MKVKLIILSILALIASACGAEKSSNQQNENIAKNLALPDTVMLTDLKEKDGSYYLNDKLYTGVAIREYNEEKWEIPALLYEMKNGKFHGKYENKGPGWYILGYYKQGMAHGKWDVQDHTEREIQYFVNAKKHGVWEFYSDSELYKKQTFENDVLMSEQKFYPILGTYKNVDADNCTISLVIGNNDNDFVYLLNVNGKSYEGKVSIMNEVIVLEGIPWVANHGDVQGKDIPLGAREPTFGIEFVRDEGKLQLQNNGNAMNYYQKLNCDEKFITLEREAF